MTTSKSVLISDLIEELKRLQIEHGNVACSIDDGGTDFPSAWPKFSDSLEIIIF